jgi:hypothetical protein
MPDERDGKAEKARTALRALAAMVASVGPVKTWRKVERRSAFPALRSGRRPRTTEQVQCPHSVVAYLLGKASFPMHIPIAAPESIGHFAGGGNGLGNPM